MISAFSPGHITCFFRPVSSYDPLSAGSTGAGIRLELGATAELEESASDDTSVTIDDKLSEGRIVRRAIGILDPHGRYDVKIRHDLPIGQGFGTTAADAVAVALAVCDIKNKSPSEGYRAAHIADLLEGGGRGDVAGIMCKCRHPVRKVAGIPPFGKVEGSDVKIKTLTLATLGEPLITDSILSDEGISAKISKAGAKALEDYVVNMTLSSLFKISNRFSKEAGLLTDEMDDVIRAIQDRGHLAAMCMLGNSIFTTAPPESVRDIIGNVWMVSCDATSEKAGVIRTK